MKLFLLLALPIVLLSASIIAQDLKPILLPKPDTSGGIPLMQALKHRQTSREFSPDTLTFETLSNLLWAACGVNRPESGKRTAPSARNWQEIELYLATMSGVYLYDPTAHSITLIIPDDIREQTGMQPFVKDAPLNVLFVADYSRMSDASEQDKQFYAGVDAGFISQNIYLYCASAGLATVVRGSVDRENLAKLLKLKPEQHVVLGQTVGLPK